MTNTLKIFIFAVVVVVAFVSRAYTAETPFTLEDRDRLIRLETKLEVGFQQIDKRFEQVDKRFDQMIAFLWMLTGIFTTLTLGVIGFAYWDRRTVIKKAKEETVVEIEGEGRLRDLINALRELSKSNGEVAKVLRQFHIL